MSSLKTFSLYLAKSGVENFDDLLTDSARDLLARGEVTRLISNDFGDGGAVYLFPSRPRTPKWVAQLKPIFPLPSNIFSQSPCALLAFKKETFLFAITFSYAHVYLDDAKTESDFGLKVAVNAVSDEKLRSVERSNIGEAIRDFSQAAGQRDLRSFGIDDALDLIRKVSGRVSDSGFANTVTGSRALRFSKKIDIADVPGTAVDAATLFTSFAYKDTGFKIIDFLSPVLDTVLVSDLDAALVAILRQTTDEFEMSIPEITPDSMASFRFELAGSSEFHPDLSFDLYAANLGDCISTLTIDDLRRHRVVAYFDDVDRPPAHWSVYCSLVGSVVVGGERYALNEGAWYRVNQVFKEAADRTFGELCVVPDPKLRPLRKLYQRKEKGKRPKVFYQSEQSYNEEVAQESGYLHLDQRLIQIDDRPGAGIEACDLLDLEGRRFIHVKKSSRQSSVLSHFFKQGGNAASMVRKYEPFKIRLVDVVKEQYGAATANRLKSALKERWTVDFRIADFPRLDGAHNIPFFSKLTLQDEARNIGAMGFDVHVGFINLARIA